VTEGIVAVQAMSDWEIGLMVFVSGVKTEDMSDPEFCFMKPKASRVEDGMTDLGIGLILLVTWGMTEGMSVEEELAESDAYGEFVALNGSVETKGLGV